MEFGRILDPLKLDRVEWQLPNLKSDVELLQLQRIKRASEKSTIPPKIYVGLPVWADTDWVGSLYPEKTKTEHLLTEYAKQLSTVEINSTFYAIPAEATFKKWASSIKSDFRFCPKFPQSISRSLGHQPNLDELEKFIQALRTLEHNIGVSFLQLPQDFTTRSIPRLAELLQHLPLFLKTAIEFRHESFFDGDRLKQEVIELLANNRAATVITDTALYRTFVHGSVSSTRVLIRFSANNGHSSDALRVQQWVERIMTWHNAGMKEIYITVHATETRPQIEIMRLLIQKLNQELPEHHKINEPKFYDEQQSELF